MRLTTPSTLHWLLDSDPSIRWQVLRELTDAGEDVVAAERARVASEGWGARILGLQHADGSWGSDRPDAPRWETTLYTLSLLRHLGLDPASEPARAAIARTRDRFDWGAEFGNSLFFDGEVEPCINGCVLALGGYFGETRDALAQRLLREQLDDGGWNCCAPQSRHASFHSTLCVLEGLLEYTRTTGAGGAVLDAQRRGQDYLLARGLLRRRSTGEVIDPRWLRFAFPGNWYYDILRGLDYLRRAGVAADARTAEAVDIVAAQQQADGRWLLSTPHPDPPYRWNNPIPFAMEAGDGQPSRWITLRALRVLDWSSARH